MLTYSNYLDREIVTASASLQDFENEFQQALTPLFSLNILMLPLQLCGKGKGRQTWVLISKELRSGSIQTYLWKWYYSQLIVKNVSWYQIFRSALSSEFIAFSFSFEKQQQPNYYF